MKERKKIGARVLALLLAVLMVVQPAIPTQAATKIQLNKTSVTLEVKKTTKLKITGTSKKVKWSTSDKTVATVSPGGKVTAKAPGTANIVAKVSGKSYKCKVTVAGLSDSKLSIFKGKSFTLKIYGTKIKSIKSSNTKIATVNSKGKITAKKAGTATITVKGKNKKTYKCKVTVTIPVSKVKLNKTSLTLDLNGTKTATLKATLSPKNAKNKKVSYKSSKKNVATVSSSGVVTAKKVGTTTITVTAKDGSKKSASCKVTVKNSAPVVTNVTATGVTLSSSSLSLNLYGNNTATLTATVSPSNTTNKSVAWSSSDTSVVTVDSTGKVTAVGTGSAKITATTKDGSNKSASCNVSVANEAVVSTSQELNNALNSGYVPSVVKLSSKASETFEISEGNYSSTTLVVDVPNGEVINEGQFEAIEVESIAENTFVEKALNNRISVKALTGHIQIASGARASIDFNGAKDQTIHLENNGSINQITMNNKVELTIDGNQSASSIPVEISADAKDSRIKTFQALDLTLRSLISLILGEGAEGTTAIVEKEAYVPSVSGFGSVEVVDETSNKVVETVVASATDEVSSEKTFAISGTVKHGEDAVEGAVVYLVPYAEDITEENLDTKLDGNEHISTDASGNYSLSSASMGNYYLVATKDGYVNEVQTLLFTSSSSETYVGDFYLLTKEEANSKGSISGSISDNQVNGDNKIEFSVLVTLYKGFNSVGGTKVKSVVATDGTYSLEDIPYGNYTIQVSTYDSEKPINTDYFNVTLLNESVTKDLSVTQSMRGKGQVQFILRWAKNGTYEEVPSDLDSHLVGPDASGTGQFHTYYVHKAYIENDIRYADLDRDDTDYEGPETTTIYEQVGGVYSFYVFDFSNQTYDDPYMSDQSDATVTVMKGSTTIATYSVPTGKKGHLWHVCDYNSVTGKLTAVNEIIQTNAESEDVGLSEETIARRSLKNALESLDAVIQSLDSCDYKSECQNIYNSAQSVYNSTSATATDINAQTEIVKARVSEAQNLISELGISKVYVDGVEKTYTVTNKTFVISDVADALGTVTVEAKEGCTATVTKASDAPYEYIIRVENAEEKIAAVYYVTYSFNRTILTPESITGDGITNFEIDDEDSSEGLIYVYGTADSLPNMTVTGKSVDGKTADKIEIKDHVASEDDEWSNILKDVVITYGSHTYTWHVRYSFDNTSFAMDASNVSGEGIYQVRSSVEARWASGSLHLTGVTDTSPKDLEFRLPAGVSYQEGYEGLRPLTELEDYDADDNEIGYLKLQKGSKTFTYYVYYECNAEGAYRITAVHHGDDDIEIGDSSWYGSTGDIRVLLTEEQMTDEEFYSAFTYDLPLYKGVSGTLSNKDDDGNYTLTLTVGSGDAQKTLTYTFERGLTAHDNAKRNLKYELDDVSNLIARYPELEAELSGVYETAKAVYEDESSTTEELQEQDNIVYDKRWKAWYRYSIQKDLATLQNYMDSLATCSYREELQAAYDKYSAVLEDDTLTTDELGEQLEDLRDNVVDNAESKLLHLTPQNLILKVGEETSYASLQTDSYGNAYYSVEYDLSKVTGIENMDGYTGVTPVLKIVDGKDYNATITYTSEDGSIVRVWKLYDVLPANVYEFETVKNGNTELDFTHGIYYGFKGITVGVLNVFTDDNVELDDLNVTLQSPYTPYSQSTVESITDYDATVDGTIDGRKTYSKVITLTNEYEGKTYTHKWYVLQKYDYEKHFSLDETNVYGDGTYRLKTNVFNENSYYNGNEWIFPVSADLYGLSENMPDLTIELPEGVTYQNGYEGLQKSNQEDECGTLYLEVNGHKVNMTINYYQDTETAYTIKSIASNGENLLKDSPGEGELYCENNTSNTNIWFSNYSGDNKLEFLRNLSVTLWLGKEADVAVEATNDENVYTMTLSYDKDGEKAKDSYTVYIY